MLRRELRYAGDSRWLLATLSQRRLARQCPHGDTMLEVGHPGLCQTLNAPGVPARPIPIGADTDGSRRWTGRGR